MYDLFFVLENVRSAYNVGSIFRIADAANITKIYLTGYTPTPLEPKLQKTALGAINTVAWEHHCDTVKLIRWLKEQDITLWSCETRTKAKSIYQTPLNNHIALIFGNEVQGLSQVVLDTSDLTVTIPQFGQKESLNIASAVGIVAYECRRRLNHLSESQQ